MVWAGVAPGWGRGREGLAAISEWLLVAVRLTAGKVRQLGLRPWQLQRVPRR